MSVVEQLHQLGGVATRRRLVELCSRVAVDRALASGDVVVVARGRYALAAADEAMLAAHRLTGIVSHTSATLVHGWEVARPPERPHITLPRNRRVERTRCADVDLHRADLEADDIDGVVTSKDRTLLDCLRALPFDDALAVADSALRSGYPPDRLLALARDAEGPGSARVRAVARAADGAAANPFESVLRGITTRVEGLTARPQVTIRDPHYLGRPDLVDECLRIVIEADSFAWHGSRPALVRDANRYNQFAVHGWLVLRFTWEDVLLHPDEVRAVLVLAVQERTQQRCVACRHA